MARDRIYLRDVRARCVIGVDEAERQAKQDVVMNVTLEVDLSAAGRSDRIEDTVDYAGLEERLVAVVERSSFALLERLAQQVAAECLADARVQRVTVTVDKPGALRCTRSVAVEIVRDQAMPPDKSVCDE